MTTFQHNIGWPLHKCADGMMLVPTVAKFGQYARHELRSNIVITANSQQRAVVVPWSQQSHCSHNIVTLHWSQDEQGGGGPQVPAGGHPEQEEAAPLHPGHAQRQVNTSK